MSFEVWLTYLATVLVFMIIPGPSHLLMLSNSTMHAPKSEMSLNETNATPITATKTAGMPNRSSLVRKTSHAPRNIKPGSNAAITEALLAVVKAGPGTPVAYPICRSVRIDGDHFC